MLRRNLAFALLLAGLAVSAGHADWLVLRDGQKIETKGAWKEKGKMMVFTLPGGTLSSIRADTVDLEATRVANEPPRAEAAAEAAPPAKKEPVLVLTDADLPQRYGSEEPNAESAGAPEVEGGEKTPGTGISVAGWQRIEDFGKIGFDIVGTFRNGSANMATDIQVTVELFDAEGELIQAAAAKLSTASLGPGETGQFTATFDGATDFASLRFNVSSFDFKTAQTPADEG